MLAVFWTEERRLDSGSGFVGHGCRISCSTFKKSLVGVGDTSGTRGIRRLCGMGSPLAWFGPNVIRKTGGRGSHPSRRWPVTFQYKLRGCRGSALTPPYHVMAKRRHPHRDYQYERLRSSIAHQFAGVVCDESSAIKSLMEPAAVIDGIHAT